MSQGSDPGSLVNSNENENESQWVNAREEPEPAAPPELVCRNPPSEVRIAGRQELAIRRFTQYCRNPKQWGMLLFHKVGTGKTLVSLLIALNSIERLPTSDTRIIIIAPTGLFNNFVTDLCKMEHNRQYLNKLVSYPFDDLKRDVNNKNVPMDFSNAIVIIDEAHRLLGKSIDDSKQAGEVVSKHSIIDDIYFKNCVQKAERCIIMTGTPLQKNLSDMCKLLNFVSKSNTFTRSVYAPVTITKTALQWAFVILKSFLNSAVFMSFLTSLPASLSSFYARLFPMAEAATPAAASPAEGKQIPAMMVAVAFSLIIAASTYVITKVKTKLEEQAKVGKRAIIQRGGSTRKLRAVQSGGLIVGRFFANMLEFVGIPLAKEALIKQAIINPYIAALQAGVSELYDISWDAELLAKHASEFISIYDPDIHIELTPGFLPDFVHNYGESAGLLRTKIAPDSGGSSFAKRIDKTFTVIYSTYQLKNLNLLFLGELPLTLKRILYLDEYESSQPDVRSLYKSVRKYARMFGNLSEDVETYYVMKTSDAKQYMIKNRDTGDTVTNPEMLTSSGEGRGKLFSCPKFELLLHKLKTMRERGVSQVGDSETDEGYEPQPHIVIENGVNKQYLPLVYSYTEDYGLALFAAFLTANGYTYILMHPDQQPDVLLESQTAGNERTYAPLSEADKTTNPLCVLLHPTMTEGYNFTKNPAIFCTEPCNSFGDAEQVYGRVLRRYPNPINPIPKKLIGLFTCVTPADQHEILKYFKFAVDKIEMISPKLLYSDLILTPQDISSIFSSLKMQSPDLFASETILKERKHLKNFETNVYGGASSDLLESALCAENASAFEIPVPACVDILNGTGCDGEPTQLYRVIRDVYATGEPIYDDKDYINARKGDIVKPVNNPRYEMGEESLLFVKKVDGTDGYIKKADVEIARSLHNDRLLDTYLERLQAGEVRAMRAGRRNRRRTLRNKKLTSK